MDPEIGKVATDVTGKMAESFTPSLIKKVLSWGSARKSGASGNGENKNGESWERRNGSKDRRVSSVSQRLRTGFSLEYFRKTGAGKFDVLVLTRKTRDDLFAALVAEAARYQFSHRISGSVLDPAFVIDSALAARWPNWCHRPEDKNKTVFVLEEIADDVLSKYNVNKIDRRQQHQRQMMPTAANA
jgi:hypothetical protein